MKLRRMFGIALILAPVVLSTPDFYLVAQAPAQATVHGSAKDPAGIPLKDGEVRLTTDKTSDTKSRKYQYTFPIGADGTYKGAGIAPGDYVCVSSFGARKASISRWSCSRRETIKRSTLI